MSEADLSKYNFSTADIDAITKLKNDQQFSLLSYGKGGPEGTGGDLVSDFNPIAVMHRVKIDKVRTDNKEVNKRFSKAIRQINSK